MPASLLLISFGGGLSFRFEAQYISFQIGADIVQVGFRFRADVYASVYSQKQ